MQIITSVSWDIDSFIDEEAAAEFEEYIEYFNSEFSGYGPFERVKLDDGREMYHWQYREILVKDLEAVIEELSGDPADVDETMQYIPEAPKPQPVTLPKIAPEVNKNAAGDIDKAFKKSQEAIRKAHEETAKKLGGALGGLSG